MIFIAASTGIFGTGLTFDQFIMSMIVAIVGAIAIKITFSFNVNDYLKHRQERFSAKLKNACLHFEFIPEEDKSIKVRSFFVSPSGTHNWICQRCGLIRLHQDQDEHQRTVDYYLNNIGAYNKQNKRFHKLLKKSGNV